MDVGKHGPQHIRLQLRLRKSVDERLCHRNADDVHIRQSWSSPDIKQFGNDKHPDYRSDQRLRREQSSDTADGDRFQRCGL